MFRSFIISQPKWIKHYFWLINLTSIFGLIISTVLFCTKLLPLAAFITFMVICAIFLIMSIFGLVMFYKNKLYFKEGVYYYQRPFKKLATANVSDIDYVKIDSFTKEGFVTFYDKSGTILMQVKGDGWVFKNNIFLTSLKFNRIRVEK